MFKKILPILVLALSFPGSTFAATESKSEGETTLKIEDAADQKNKVPGDIDEEITNRKLRAESGSKSKYSLSFTANYYGSSLEKPFDKDRANTDGSKVPRRVTLDGDFSGRYRMDKNQSISVGTGYSLERPLQEAKRGDVSNPFMSYNYAGKIGPVQTISQVVGSVTTKKDERDVGQVAAGSLVETLMYDFGGSPLSAGLVMEVDYNHYNNKPTDTVTIRNREGTPVNVLAGGRQADFLMAAFPLVEYQLSDKINLRTVFRPWTFSRDRLMENDRGDVVQPGSWTFSKADWTQSIGVGIAVTRDVFLYPNFQFFWETWRKDDFNWFRKDTRASSTVGLAATLNIF
jgi:hypothetical protein